MQNYVIKWKRAHANTQRQQQLVTNAKKPESVLSVYRTAEKRDKAAALYQNALFVETDILTVFVEAIKKETAFFREMEKDDPEIKEWYAKTYRTLYDDIYIIFFYTLTEILKIVEEIKKKTKVQKNLVPNIKEQLKALYAVVHNNEKNEKKILCSWFEIPLH